MSWTTALAIVAIAAGATLSVIVLLAIGSLRRSLNDGTVRQAQQIKRLVETVAVLHQQQQNANARIQLLAEANRKLTEELSALVERVGEGSGVSVGSHRVLH